MAQIKLELLSLQKINLVDQVNSNKMMTYLKLILSNMEKAIKLKKKLLKNKNVLKKQLKVIRK